MRKNILLTVFALLLLPAPGAWAAEEAQTADDLVEHLIEACEPEIESYCSQVTLGEGRLLACFYNTIGASELITVWEGPH